MKFYYQQLLQNFLNLFLNISKTLILPRYLFKNELQLKNHIILHLSNCINLNSCTCNYKPKICTFTKYLDIIMNSNLKWINHINALATKLRKLSYAFKQLKCILNISQLKIVFNYKALIKSNFHTA